MAAGDVLSGRGASHGVHYAEGRMGAEGGATPEGDAAGYEVRGRGGMGGGREGRKRGGGYWLNGGEGEKMSGCICECLIPVLHSYRIYA